MTISRRVEQLYLGKFNLLIENQSLLETQAQKQAMKYAFEQALSEYPNECASSLWKCIHATHVKRKSGAELTSVQINDVISAEQSWKKSSGHAFEEFLPSFYNTQLESHGIKLCLQRDVSLLLSNEQLHNRPRDIEIISAWLGQGVFDLYVVVSNEGRNFLIGTVQAKTSIRDRVTRDREPAIQAMENFFWATALVLDGEFLRLPKFQAMVNGGTRNFSLNGWHGMYVFSELEVIDRIYDQSDFVEHCIKAKTLWLNERQEFDINWYPNLD